MADVQLTAYNVKTKEKGVPIMDAVITKTAKGAYMVQGHDGKGNKLTTLVNEEKAMAAIKRALLSKVGKITLEGFDPVCIISANYCFTTLNVFVTVPSANIMY